MVLSGFSRRHGYPRCPAGPRPLRYSQVRLGRWICLPSSAPTPFNRLFRQPAEVSLPRPRVARMASAGILTGSSICIALRLIIRVRLTPGRLTSPGNPWSCGGGESHPLIVTYAYICFSRRSTDARAAASARTGMLPYRHLRVPRLQRTASYPIIIHARSLD